MGFLTAHPSITPTQLVAFYRYKKIAGFYITINLKVKDLSKHHSYNKTCRYTNYGN